MRLGKGEMDELRKRIFFCGQMRIAVHLFGIKREVCSRSKMLGKNCRSSAGCEVFASQTSRNWFVQFLPRMFRTKRP